MKNLENYGVQALNAKELKELDGGFWGLLLNAAAAYLVYETLGNLKASGEALNKGIELGYNYNQ